MITVRVYHAGYNCDTGCCGHVVKLEGDVEHSEFNFTHPYRTRGETDYDAWARELAEEVVREQWPECFDSIDWDSLVAEVSDD